MFLVDFCDCDGIEIVPNDACGGGGFFDLGDQGDSRSGLERLDESAYRGGGSESTFKIGEGSARAGGLDLRALVSDDRLQNVFRFGIRHEHVLRSPLAV